jgi:LPS export ABC transporter protein LptC
MRTRECAGSHALQRFASLAQDNRTGMILAFMPVRTLLAASAIAALLAFTAVAASAEEPDLLSSELAVEDMTFVVSAGSHNDAIVEAERASVERNDRVARLDGVHARVGKAAGDSPFAEGGLELRCERGSFDLASGDLTAEGNVRGRTADGRRFETQRLVYRRETGRVSTRSPVVIHDAFGTIRGAGFEYWVRENRFRLTGGASVEQGS